MSRRCFLVGRLKPRGRNIAASTASARARAYSSAKSLVLQELAHKLGAHSVLEGQGLDSPVHPAGHGAYDFADVHLPGSFDALSANLHVPGVARRGRQRSAAVNPDRPEPLIHPYPLNELHLAKIKPIRPRGKRA